MRVEECGTIMNSVEPADKDSINVLMERVHLLHLDTYYLPNYFHIRVIQFESNRVYLLSKQVEALQKD
jgi:hypothetical protein